MEYPGMPPVAGPGHPDRLRIENMRAMCMLADENRLAALHRYGILDTPFEPDFDTLTSLAAAVCGAPMSIINFVDQNRQWFKAATGMSAREAPLDTAICTHAMLQSDLFIIPDTLADDRFASNPLCAGMGNLRFYAGALLKSPDGYTLGTVCVLDHEPRNLDDVQKNLLLTLAKQVMNMLEIRRQAEIHRQIGAKLDSELSIRKEILGIVTHDLRSPLNSVNLVAHLLDDLDPSTEEDLTPAEMGLMLRDCVGDMQRLLSDLSDFSVAEQGGLSMNLGKCDPLEILAGAERRFRLSADQAGIELKVVSGDLPETILVDEQRVTQAIGNLIFNALKFTPPAGRITLSAVKEGSKVTFSVSDTGCGIPADLIPHVFERFWTHADSKHGGRGIGLAIVQSIARAHGGEVTVTSEVGVGTTFSMGLPPA
ncbi:MAG: sensor histidine kinase and response regulator of a two component complex [Akkermansiaceae bacterium]|nr:sensor histidine kinase and response regulator of a two component complex [Akkermansiaceae bacterium]